MMQQADEAGTEAQWKWPTSSGLASWMAVSSQRQSSSTAPQIGRPYRRRKLSVIAAFEFTSYSCQAAIRAAMYRCVASASFSQGRETCRLNSIFAAVPALRE